MASKYCFLKKIYDKDALLKAAYHYTDIAYLHLDADETNYIVTIEMKDDRRAIEEKEFLNEILAQMVRKKVAEETKTIRELMIARAFSSTIIERESNACNFNCSQNESDKDIVTEDILEDWFETYE